MLVALQTTSQINAGVQISWAVIAAYLIQSVKKWDQIPWITFDAQNLNRLFSIFVAAATGAGIYFTFNHVNGVATITGLTLPNIYHFASSAVQQYALQHAVYKAIIAPPLPGPIQQEERKNGNSQK